MAEMIVQNIIDSFENHNYLTVIFISFVVFIYKFMNIYDFFQIYKSNKINQYNNYRNINDISEETKDYLKDCIEREIFKISTGIDCNHNLRKLIIRYYNESEGDLSFRHFYHAQRFLSVEGEKLAVKVPFMDKVQYWFYFVMFIIIIITTLFMVETISRAADITVGQKVMVLFASIIGYMVAAFMLYLAFPVSAANRIKKLVDPV